MTPTTRPCAECGRPFASSSPADAWCLECDALFRAVEPPKFLKDMRHVAEGLPPQDPGQELAARARDANPVKFLEQLRGAEREYRAHLRAHQETRRQQAREVKEGGTAQGCAVEEDEGRRRVLDLLDEEWARVRTALGLKE